MYCQGAVGHGWRVGRSRAVGGVSQGRWVGYVKGGGWGKSREVGWVS